jgi:hypothetical protein
MKKIIALSGIYCLLLSCGAKPKTAGHPDSGVTPTDSYKLRLNPVPGTSWHFDIVNESETTMKTGDLTLTNSNTTAVGALYDINKDSAGNFVLHMKYDKIKLHAKNGDKVTDLDAANAATSGDPIEKMLGLLKDAEVTTTISPTGETKSVQGYQQLTDKLMARLDVMDINVRQMAKSRWQQLIEEGVIKKNVDQLFRIFPDSAVTVGDTWTITSHQKSELNFQAVTKYTLTSIEDGVAYIESEGELENDSTTVQVKGYQVAGHIKGRQQGKYELDTTNGILLKSTITANIEGKLLIMTQEVPITIATTVKMNGKRIK